MQARNSILYVHGRGFKPSPAALEEVAVTALHKGLERDYPDCLPLFDNAHVELAYYGDLTQPLLENRGRHYDEELDIADRRNALAELAQIPKRKRFGIRQYDRLPGKSALPEFLLSIGVPLLAAIGLWRWQLDRRIPDFAAYLGLDPDYAEAVRARVREPLAALLGRGDRVMLLAHGTGTVVAWDVLWEFSHDEQYAASLARHKVDVWVTMGCPLGDNFLRRFLCGGDAPAEARFPTNVVAWDNVSAEDDYMCYDNTLADDFKAMMSERLVSVVRDFKIYNHAVRWGKSNPHSSVGYLIHPRIAKIVADWLRADEILATSPAAGSGDGN
jgi:hypothetical protein